MQRKVRQGRREGALGSGAPGERGAGQWERGWERAPGAHRGGRPPTHCPLRCPAEKEAEVYVPLWFERRLDPLTGETACMYKGGYWEAKEKQDWHMCPNIF